MSSREFLRTEHLLLRPWLPEDARGLAALAGEPTVRAATGLGPHPTRDDLTLALEDLSGEPEVFAVTSPDVDPTRPLGGVALRIGGLSGYDIGEDEGVIELWGGPELLREGAATEVVRALLSYAFDDLGLEAVVIAGRASERLTREGWRVARRADPTEDAFVSGQQAEAERLLRDVPPIASIRSGGQTGADRGGLDAAREAGLPICGWCPKGGLAEDLPEPPGVRALYPELRETPTASYVPRTAWNVRDAHATLVVAPAGLEPRSGTEMTVRFASSLARPFLVVAGTDDLPKVRTWVAGLGRGITLNVAGPRESKLPGTYATARRIVSELLGWSAGEAS